MLGKAYEVGRLLVIYWKRGMCKKRGGLGAEVKGSLESSGSSIADAKVVQ